MPVRVFQEEERKEVRKKMLEAGIPLLKEYGMTHMSVSKIADAAGIGKSTFYNFFTSKEAYVLELIQYRRRELPRLMDEILAGREKMTKEEAKHLIKSILFSEQSVYQYMTLEDENHLLKAFPELKHANLEREVTIMQYYFQRIEGVKKELNYAVISNLMKSIVLIWQGKEILHESGREQTMDAMFELLFSYVFEER